jgi:RND family efflux transporter MFP subunit
LTEPERADPADAARKDRIASLAALRLDKGPAGAPAPARRSSKLPWILLVLVTTAGGYYHHVTVRAARTATPPGAAPPAAPPGARTTANAGLLASGYLAARAPIVLSAGTGGRLAALEVDNGDRVEKGQVVAVLADGTLRAELELARARLRDAQRSHQRVRTLASAEAATLSDVERALGQVEIAQAEVRVIEQRLDDTRIRSPIAGTVLEVLARPGEALVAGPGQAAGVLRIADLSGLVAEVDVNEGELGRVRLGQEAEVIGDAQRERAYRGVVREIAEQADRSRGTVLVKVHIAAAADGALRPGMAIQVRFGP